MEFVNECSCIVDYSVLEKAIIEECNRRNIVPKILIKFITTEGMQEFL